MEHLSAIWSVDKGDSSDTGYQHQAPMGGAWTALDLKACVRLDYR